MRMSHNFQERRYSEHPHQIPAREELRRDGGGALLFGFIAFCLVMAANAENVADTMYSWGWL